VTGDDLPVHDMLKAANFSTGRPTDWVKVRAGIDEMEKLLRRQGYLQATLRPTRSLHDDTGVVDLTVAVSKGRQSFLGSVQMTGLDPANLGRARKAWSLKSGAPLDYYYVLEEYIKSLKLAGPPRRVSVELKPQGGASVVDVAITFR